MKWQFEAIGTRWQIEAGLSAAAEEACRAAISVRIEEFDRAYSRFRPDSLVSRMAVEAGEFELPADAQPMLGLYRRLYELTDGAMTPLIGGVLSDAGYDAQYSFKSKPLTSPPAWDKALAFEDGVLTVKRPVLLDVGAAGKGYLVDLVAGVLVAHGATSYMVDAGGDICQCDPAGRSLRVGLEHPARADEVIGVATIANQSICGSAGNRRAWGAFHHIIDPRTLVSPRRLQAVWVVAGTTMLADALATALFFVPPGILEPEFDFEWLAMNAEDQVASSSGFPAEIFTRADA